MTASKTEKGKTVIDLTKPRPVARYIVAEYEKKLRIELKKLSKCNGVNLSFIGSCELVLQLKKEKADERARFALWATGENEKIILEITKDALKDFVSFGTYEQYKELDKLHKNAFIDEILSTITANLKYRTKRRDYWCGLVEEPRQIDDNIEQFRIWILIFDREKLEQNLVIGLGGHSFWERLRIEWQHPTIAIGKADLCYNELYRRASLLDDFLRYYENDVNVLSSMRYEGSSNEGSIMCLLPQYSQEYKKLKKNFRVRMKFENPISFGASNYKKIRKLLEITTGDLSLLLDENGEIFAIGTIKKNPLCDYCKVKFNGYLNWDYYVNGSIKINFVNMIPMIPDKVKGIGKDDEKTIEKTFGESCNLDAIKMIINKAIDQKHGTMVVFSENAMEEADRLKDYGLRVNKFKMTEDVVPSITSIDGALICDPQGYCYLIGAILDGKAAEKADSSRGARYNSALKYIEQQDREKIKSLIVVVSEDGYVDFLSTEIND